MPNPAPIDDRVKTKWLDVRISQQLDDKINEAAERASLSRSEWIRLVCTLAAGAEPRLSEVARIWGTYHSRRGQRLARGRARS